jgi:uncharacterized protein
MQHFLLFSMGGYPQQWPTRLIDQQTMLTSMVLQLPWFLAVMTLGMLAARLGWLTRPGRHTVLWRNARLTGWAALPLAAAAAWLKLGAMTHTPAQPSVAVYFLEIFAGAVTFLYVGLAVSWRDGAWMRSAIAWLAPAGRMALTNYLAQSVLMGVLLAGWGLGLGTRWQHAELSLCALCIGGLQLAVSRLWIVRHGQGPVEALWRHVTYRRLPQQDRVDGSR